MAAFEHALIEVADPVRLFELNSGQGLFRAPGFEPGFGHLQFLSRSESDFLVEKSAGESWRVRRWWRGGIGWLLSLGIEAGGHDGQQEQDEPLPS